MTFRVSLGQTDLPGRPFLGRPCQPQPVVLLRNTGCVLLEGRALVRSYDAAATGLVDCLAKRATRRSEPMPNPMCAAACAED